MASIVIVEDEAIVAMENKLGLNNAGHNIVAVVSSAKEAILAFKENAPDLMLMDIQLKGEMDGIDVMTEIRQHSLIPVIFVTGNSDHRTKERIEAIANASYMSKPLLGSEIIAEVNRMLSDSKSIEDGE